ncbi:MAG: hypothetical protein PHF11_08080 [Candidatus Omnitrophica bacterium]|nr:hypothetical protein [Candidatus Omnitrophota bacterium]
MKHKDTVAPLPYARQVKERFTGNEPFMRLTVKFEEANYSHHEIACGYAWSALNDYNDFLKILFSHHGKFTLLRKYLLSLINTTPMAMPQPDAPAQNI